MTFVIDLLLLSFNSLYTEKIYTENNELSIRVPELGILHFDGM
jgi:hypothetical protein